MNKVLATKLRLTRAEIVFFSVLAVALHVLFISPKSYALSGSYFNPGRIIDDTVFTNSQSMAVQDIQLFLEKTITGGSCDSDGTRPSGYWNAALNRYYTHSEWGIKNSNPPPYVCLTTYREITSTKRSNIGSPSALKPGDGSVSAAEIILDAAQQYKINPQVLLTLIC